MALSIKQFTVAIFLIFTLITYTLFAKYYFEQQEQTASVIMRGLKNDLSELTYLLSRHITRESILTSRALLDRKAATHDYISAISIFDDKKLLVTTDPSFSVAPSSIELFRDRHKDIYTSLTKSIGLEESIHYYEGKKFKNYTLTLFIDQKFVENSFIKMRDKLVILFVIPPILILLLLAIIIHKAISKPLEKLRRYAYHHTNVPKKFFISEIEYIRSSMVQTFDRLEQEKLELYTLARTDSLSGLANRNHLEERVEEIIAVSKRNNKEFALLFLDLDHFKSVNDSLGHNVGDELLRNIAHVIQELLRPNDVVARIGGDEFVIVLTQCKSHIELIKIVDRIQKRLATPWQIQTFPINITSSIGITLYPKDGESLLTLMKHADIAMYEAKEKGRKGYSFFTKELNNKTQEYINLTNTMKEALQKNRYVLYYQPQNRVSTGEIIGAEALIRWEDPKKGIIPPNVFIPIAEQNGFITVLGDWILDTAIAQKKEWENKGIDIKLSINVAAKQVLEDDFVPTLEGLLQKYKINASKLSLEITEYIFLDNSISVYKTFESIKKLGVQISLDDFGTGYSSLSYLKDFPLDILKIDKIFMDNYKNDDGAIFVETIIKIAQTLRLEVVAEGVESKEQITFLKTLGCDFYQGYVCSKPISSKDFENLYERSRL